jgi:Uncharacterised protein family UPF0547
MSEESAETRVCPDCAEQVKEQARVCRFCGYRFDRTPVAAALSAPELIFAQSNDTRGWLLRWGLVSALLMALGSVGPWVRVRAFAGGGFVETRGGLLVLVAAVTGAVFLVAWRQRRPAGIAALLIGLLGLAVALHDRRHLVNLLGGRHFPPRAHFLASRFIHVGWGLDLALLASLSLAICGLVWLLAVRDESPRSPRLVNARV